ncbi:MULTISPECIES: tyrosine-type recombinase/integrase [unclassified Novosphingobium]|uniref:tyrosine-type recombinase/integrase n=1 Tax=unclassified Novosphingobium TaxID=2644732 RepID=UPI00146E9853|nr:MULTISPECIES: tyrosine-type recombinase/integrase [unclassified Novosphingobium]NMN06823.1 site-specific recombinase XerD [Novosphingobium sp. SG919]NMN88727.1 site-specific recombinase XerD [Novosphingobium sp. SG916]
MNILPGLIERFFNKRLIQQRDVSQHTVASYRDAFRLLLGFAYQAIRKAPSHLTLGDLTPALIVAFLDDLERERGISAATRNLRLTAIKAFFNFVAFEEPAFASQAQQIGAIPSKIARKRELQFLDRAEIEAVLAAPDRTTWIGRRDHLLMLLAAQTGLRLSELIGLERDVVSLGVGAHVRCLGKGRKGRSTPLTRVTRDALARWLEEPSMSRETRLFPNIHGGPLSPDAVQRLLSKHVAVASRGCPSLIAKRVSPHVLRHSAAMALLSSGVDSAVISLWLGHESSSSTQAYLHAHLGMKEAALAKVRPLGDHTPGRFKPDDRLLRFLNSL